MSEVPIAILVVISLTLGFEGLIFGQDFLASSFPPLLTVNPGSCGPVNNIVDATFWIGCQIGQIVLFVGNVFLVIGGVVLFLFNLVSFNVPGAPLFVRFVVGTAIGGTLIWSIAALFRGD